jgi:hypothetical protein
MERRLQYPTPRTNPVEERQNRLGANGGGVGDGLRGVSEVFGLLTAGRGP